MCLSSALDSNDSSFKVFSSLTLFISNHNNLWQIHKKNNKHLQNK